MLHFLYSKYKTTYPDERQRVQQGFLMIIHPSSGLRPSSVMQSNKGRRKMEADKTAGSGRGNREASISRHGAPGR